MEDQTVAATGTRHPRRSLWRRCEAAHEVLLQRLGTRGCLVVAASMRLRWWRWIWGHGVVGRHEAVARVCFFAYDLAPTLIWGVPTRLVMLLTLGLTNDD
jgi:hypothetical protein